jgi:hypothetical protein
MPNICLNGIKSKIFPIRSTTMLISLAMMLLSNVVMLMRRGELVVGGWSYGDTGRQIIMDDWN